VFSALTIVGLATLCVYPFGAGICGVPLPSTTTTTAPPNTIGGQWEYVGFSQSEAVDIVHIALMMALDHG
jgi:hypothetical protein